METTEQSHDKLHLIGQILSNWKIDRNADGSVVVTSNNCGCIASSEPRHSREIPESVLHSLACDVHLVLRLLDVVGQSPIPAVLANGFSEDEQGEQVGLREAASGVVPLCAGLDRIPDALLSDWIDGSIKPGIDGPYLRDFPDGEAVSWFKEGSWTRDGFFESDDQGLPWRGIKV